jgi:hypothetical protein
MSGKFLISSDVIKIAQLAVDASERALSSYQYEKAEDQGAA